MQSTERPEESITISIVFIFFAECGDQNNKCNLTIVCMPRLFGFFCVLNFAFTTWSTRNDSAHEPEKG